jgi:hypothetical protein
MKFNEKGGVDTERWQMEKMNGRAFEEIEMLGKE